ncbi:MAG: hypothetical protein GTN36_04060 [Candidatus Aenigmarchaeota archaeon]|nr:hypothetical protein [Candidatus Aenigmarchaeota archaeon]
MKKRNWIIFIILFIVADLIIFYIFYPSSPAQDIFSTSTEQQEGENETQTPDESTFPELPEEPSEGSGGEGGSGSGEGGSGGSGGGGEEPTGPTGPVNYTLYVKSEPSNLSVFVNYSIDGTVLTATDDAPYSLRVDGNSIACVLAAELKGSGTLKWTKDGEDCISSLCYPPFFGCEVLMDSDHTVTEHWNASATE